MEKEINIIYEDEHLVLLDKPSGLVVNRSNTCKELTLQDILDSKYKKNLKDVEDTEFINRSGIVHRLDKDTSGIILAAKDVDTFRFLQRQFKERKTLKEYYVLVHGNLEDEIMEINAPLGRNPKNPLKMAVVSTGKNAFTRVEKIKNSINSDKEYSLARVFPKTGRTHQIRVHLFAIGHAVVGDSIYCAKNLLEQDLEYFGRMMLHARFLGFTHPLTGKFRRFESPLPKEFKI